MARKLHSDGPLVENMSGISEAYCRYFFSYSVMKMLSIANHSFPLWMCYPLGFKCVSDRRKSEVLVVSSLYVYFFEPLAPRN